MNRAHLLTLFPEMRLSRVRHGHATNSSSSHSMVVLPGGVQVPDEKPHEDDDSPWRYRYDGRFVAASEGEKRHYLAGLLTAQAGQLWGQGVRASPDDDPVYAAAWKRPDLPEGAPAEEKAQERQERDEDAALFRLAERRRAVPRHAFDSRPLGQDVNMRPDTTLLPEWLEADIVTLCGLPAGTDLTNHWTEDGLSGRPPVEVPRCQGGTGPDPVAWAAILAVALDPTTVLLQPEENQSHLLEDLYQQSWLSRTLPRSSS